MKIQTETLPGNGQNSRMKSSYRGHRFPPEIIKHAIWLYHRFTLSFRAVEDLLAEQAGIFHGFLPTLSSH